MVPPALRACPPVVASLVAAALPACRRVVDSKAAALPVEEEAAGADPVADRLQARKSSRGSNEVKEPPISPVPSDTPDILSSQNQVSGANTLHA